MLLRNMSQPLERKQQNSVYSILIFHICHLQAWQNSWFPEGRSDGYRIVFLCVATAFWLYICTILVIFGVLFTLSSNYCQLALVSDDLEDLISLTSKLISAGCTGYLFTPSTLERKALSFFSAAATSKATFDRTPPGSMLAVRWAWGTFCPDFGL